MKKTDKTLSVLIVNYRADEYLKKCIPSLREQRMTRRMEIILIQNGSWENRDPDIKGVSVIRNSRNEGFARANNLGLAKAAGDYILMLNPDTIVPPGTLEKCVRMMEQDRDIGVLGCRLLNEDRSLQSSCRNFPAFGNILIENLGLHHFLGGFGFFRNRYLMIWPHDSVRVVDSVKGAFMMTRREVVESVGLLDDHFFMYCEEVDFCLRAKEKGWKTAFTPDASIIHFGGKSTEIHSLKNLVELHKSYRYYCRKHFNSLESAICIFLYFLGVSSRALFHIEGSWSNDGIKRERFRLFYETAKSYFK
jgi:GT2 family glycosyltransferase